MSKNDIQCIRVPNIVFNTKKHCSGHVFLCFTINDIKYVVLGHNDKNNYVASFGGFSDPGETLFETILREFAEESLECIFDKDTLKKYLKKGIIIVHESPRGYHYSVFCDIHDIVPNIETINIAFRKKLKNPNLLKCQKENNFIVMLSLAEIKKCIDDSDDDNNVIIKTNLFETDIYLKIRSINVPSFKFMFSHSDLFK